jgi:hypothetical protein
MGTLAGDVKVALLVGELMATVGGLLPAWTLIVPVKPWTTQEYGNEPTLVKVFVNV